MQVNQVNQNHKSNPAFQSLNLHITSKPEELVFKAVRRVLAPKKGELTSKIVTRSFVDDIGIDEFNAATGHGLYIKVAPRGEKHLHEYDILLLTPSETVRSLAKKIRIKFDGIYRKFSARSGQMGM